MSTKMSIAVYQHSWTLTQKDCVSMNIYTPTHLYIKQHSVTGKLYFGKTIKNPETYLGSGDYWKSHITKHGKEYVVTLWYELFYNKSELISFALSFSKDLNIVASTSWLNLKPENGLNGGMPGVPSNKKGKTHVELYGPKRAAKISLANSLAHKNKPSPAKGKQRSNESILKQSKTMKGRPAHNKGKPNSNKNKPRVKPNSNKGKPKPSIVCPHCGKSGGYPQMIQWHFNNCRSLIF